MSIQYTAHALTTISSVTLTDTCTFCFFLLVVVIVVAMSLERELYEPDAGSSYPCHIYVPERSGGGGGGGSDEFWFRRHDVAGFCDYTEDGGGCGGGGLPAEWNSSWSDLAAAAAAVDDRPSDWQPDDAFVHELGLYALLLRSDRPEALGFVKWVHGVVLPSLRRSRRGKDVATYTRTGAVGLPDKQPVVLLIGRQEDSGDPITYAVKREQWCSFKAKHNFSTIADRDDERNQLLQAAETPREYLIGEPQRVAHAVNLWALVRTRHADMMFGLEFLHRTMASFLILDEQGLRLKYEKWKKSKRRRDVFRFADLKDCLDRCKVNDVWDVYHAIRQTVESEGNLLRAGDARAHDARADEERADEERADDVRADDERAEDERADDERADDERADDERAEDERADDGSRTGDKSSWTATEQSEE